MSSFWDKDIMYLKKVGPVRAKALREHCGISSYRDLLHYYPRKYVDRRTVSKIHELSGEEAQLTLIGRITHFSKQEGKKARGNSRLTATFTDGSGFIELIWFQGVRWIEKQLTVGKEIAIFGRPSRFKGRIQISHPEMDVLTEDEGLKHTSKIVPYYPSNEKLSKVGLDSKGFRTIIHQLLEEGKNYLPDNLNQKLKEKYSLVSRKEAILGLHFPLDFNQLEASQHRLKFEEFFFFQLMLAQKRSTHQQTRKSNSFPVIGKYFNQFYEEYLPFELTNAQKRVLREIRKDLGKDIQMNRLVQGDVGSGKTMVAFMAMLIGIDNGFQTALMAPTAILAEQHYRKLSKYAGPLGLRVGLLVGGQKKAERSAILKDLAEGSINIIAGTHALIEDPVVFQKLGLVVVDEQHKFGVMQRAKLWNKARPFPHNLIMTATPIPRTMAMTLYGDLEVSVIDELPPGRKPIKTMQLRESKRLEVLGFIKREIEDGRQAYVVYPLVEESEKLDLIAATKGFELLEKYFHPYRVGIVHGKMKPDDKELEMKRFLEKNTQILVSTTVIEVGVDVPNASVMLIENAERFGLSQLHQLRGRVGRGGTQSYCILLAGNKLSKEGKLRLNTMVETQDGFKIAEKDLELRGPGDFLGTRQSGLPEFQLANIAEDQFILQEAREAAFSLLEEDPSLSMKEHQSLSVYYNRFRRQHADLGTVA